MEDRQRRREVGEKEEARSKMCVCVFLTLNWTCDLDSRLHCGVLRKKASRAGGCQGVYGPMGSEPDVKNTER